ncbi:unnamed protein product [Parajaminaea phylloscopi]
MATEVAAAAAAAAAPGPQVSPPSSPTEPPPIDSLPPPFAATPSDDLASASLLAQPTAVSKLSLTDRLLLAQIVHSQGECPPNWLRVSTSMLNHPLVKSVERQKAAADAGLTMGRIFGSRECERSWVQLMRQYNLTTAGEEADTDAAGPLMKQRPKEARGPTPRTDRRSQLALAQILYTEKMEELRDSIKKKEEEFKALIQKIDGLKTQSAAADVQPAKAIAAASATNSTRAKDATAERPKTPKAKTPTASKVSNAPAPMSGDGVPAPTAVVPPGDPVPAAAEEDTETPAIGGKEQTAIISKDSEEVVEPTVHSNDSKEQDQDASTRDLAAAAAAAAAAQGEKETPASAALGPADVVEEQLEAERQSSGPSTPLPARQAEQPSPSKTNSPTSSPAGKTKRAKRKRDDQAEEDVTPNDQTDRPAMREAKRTRSSTITAPREEPGEEERPLNSSTKKTPVSAVSRPTPTTRRSTRRAIKDGDEASAGDPTTDAEATSLSTPTGSVPSRQRAAGRRSGVGRSSTQSREPSAMREDERDVDEESDKDTSMNVDEDPQTNDGDGPAGGASEEMATAVTAATTGTRKGAAAVQASRRESAASTSVPTSAATSHAKKAASTGRGRANQKSLLQILNQVSAHRNANVFQNDVRPIEAPDYRSLIRRPTSLKTVKAAIKDNRITTITQLRASLEEVFANAIMFNRPGGHNPLHGYAQEMRADVDVMLREHEAGANGAIVPGGLGLTRSSSTRSAAARQAAAAAAAAAATTTAGDANEGAVESGRSSRARSRA